MLKTATTTLQFKATIKGCLEFGNPKSYEMMFNHFQKRLELYYKNDILLKNPDYFSAEYFTLDIPRTTVNCMDKTWKNTVALLKELRAFAVAGTMHVWISDNNKPTSPLLVEEIIEPQGDKAATMEYARGLKALQKGQEKVAIEAFSKAIEKYSRFAQAFERRGNAYYLQGLYEDAMIDFNKSASLRPTPEAYFGMGEAEKAMGDFNKAIQYFQIAIDNAVPYQPIFWMARRVKGECHAHLNELDKAGFELKLVTKRTYKPTDPNYDYRKQALQIYGEVLMKSGNTSEAANAFREALSIESCAIVEELLRSINKDSMYTSQSVNKNLVLASN